MAGENPDEMVFAGTSSAHRSSTNPFHHILRGTSLVLLVDLAIICYFFTNLVFAFVSSQARFAVFGLYFLGYMVYRGYSQQEPWAYPFAMAILYTIGLGFGVLGLINCVLFIASLDLFTLLVGVIMLWAAKGSIQRARMHSHPTYQAGYFKRDNALDFQLEEGEMLAACPNCLAVLAIQPMQLSSSDKCPHCNYALVSERLENKYVQYSDQEE